MNKYEKAYLISADTDYIVESVVPSDTSFTLAHQPDYPRTITWTITSSTITAGTITMIGTDMDDKLISESFDLSTVLTGETTIVFKTISDISISGLTGEDPADRLVVGISGTIQLTNRTCSFISAVVGGGSGTIGKYQFIDGLSGTTTNVGELKEGIESNTYNYGVSIGVGLRIVISGDTPITINYEI